MPYDPVQPGRHPAYDYLAFHNGPLCVTDLVSGPTSVQAYCRTCKVMAQLSAIAERISVESSIFPRSPA